VLCIPIVTPRVVYGKDFPERRVSLDWVWLHVQLTPAHLSSLTRNSSLFLEPHHAA
jgi:hypothetical protein